MKINSINSSYNKANTHTNNSPSFGNFVYQGVNQQHVTEIFGNQQNADLFEKITDEKHITVVFSNEKVKRTPESKGVYSLTAKIIDPKPAKGQEQIKTINSADTTTLPDTMIFEKADELQEQNPGLERNDFLTKLGEIIERLKHDRFAQRLKESMISCKAKTDNMIIGVQLETEENYKRYGKENVNKMKQNLINEYDAHNVADIITSSSIYNNK